MRYVDHLTFTDLLLRAIKNVESGILIKKIMEQYY